MRFAAPHILWLLLPLVPGLIAFFWWAARKREHLLTNFVNARLLPGLLAGVSPRRRKFREACIIAAAALIVIALAQPQWGFSWQEVKQRGLDIVVAVDTSKSMLATDIAPSRIARARFAALDLMQLARTDRLGLVAFAGSAFLQCPLTIDDAAFRQSVEAIQVGVIPHGGTALGEAIKASLTAFKESDNYKVLVIISDGEDHDPGALEAAKEAAEQGLRIFTIGVGTPEGEILQFKNDAGQQDYVRDEAENVVKSRLNEGLLQQVATAASGFYLPMRGAKTIDTLYEKGLAPLPKSESREKLVQRFHERFHWPLGAAILLLVLEQFIPERHRSPGRAAVAALALLFFSAPGISSASSWEARRDYQAGRFEEALKEYKDLMRQDKKEDPRLPYNAGAAAYRSGQFNEAARLFGQAINTPDLNLQEQAYYNRGNALFQSGEREQDPQARRKAWEQALKDFEASLKLSPQDADAQHNHEYVKRRLEELKQQQQQNQQQDSNKDQQQQQDQNQQQDQQKQDQQDQNQQNQQQQQSQEEQQKKSDQNQQQDSQQQQDKQQQPSPGEQEQKPQPQQGEQKENEGEQEQQPQPAEGKPGEMTPQQAAQFLDAQENDTRLMPLPVPNSGERKVRKDW